MKKLITLTLFASFAIFASAQNVPIDYEPGGNGAGWTWTVFENDDNPPLEIIANPDPTGLNTSSTVAKYTTRATGNPWAGCETMHGAGIGTWTIDSTNAIINILVWKSVISDVGIKLVRSDNWSLGEIKIPNTTTNQWEQISFDFSSHMGNTYDQIVVFPDFLARSSDNVIYFDNIYGGVSTGTSIADPGTNDVQVYPNPANTRISIKTDQTVEKVEIFDMAGTLQLSHTVTGTASNLDISTLAAGIYLVKTTLDGLQVVDKLIKE